MIFSASAYIHYSVFAKLLNPLPPILIIQLTLILNSLQKNECHEVAVTTSGVHYREGGFFPDTTSHVHGANYHYNSMYLSSQQPISLPEAAILEKHKLAIRSHESNQFIWIYLTSCALRLSSVIITHFFNFFVLESCFFAVLQILLFFRKVTWFKQYFIEHVTTIM